MVTYSGSFYLTSEFAETAEIMMIIKRYNSSAHSAHSAVRYLYVIELIKLCTQELRGTRLNPSSPVVFDSVRLLPQVLHDPIHHCISIVSRINCFEAEAEVDRVVRADGRAFRESGTGHAHPVIKCAAAFRGRTDSPRTHADLEVLKRVAGKLDVIHEDT